MKTYPSKQSALNEVKHVLEPQLTQRIGMIKELRSMLTLGLKEAKDLADEFWNGYAHSTGIYEKVVSLLNIDIAPELEVDDLMDYISRGVKHALADSNPMFFQNKIDIIIAICENIRKMPNGEQSIAQMQHEIISGL